MILWTVLVFMLSCSKRELELMWHDKDYAVLKVGYNEPSSTKGTPQMMEVYIYSGDSLIRSKEVSVLGDTIMVPAGEYDVISINPNAAGVNYQSLDQFSRALVAAKEIDNKGDNLLPPSDVYCNSKGGLKADERSYKEIKFNLEDLSKKVVYQLVIEGAKDSLDRCIVTQRGIAKGVVLHNGSLYFGDGEEYSSSFEVSKENNYSNHLYILGIDSTKKELELAFQFKNKTEQKATIDISTLGEGDIYSRKMIMYVDISLVNMELRAVVKSWIMVEDVINI